MRSKTSYFNGTLFRKNLARFWPLWGGASFIGALFPLALLTQLLRYGARDVIAGTALDMTRIYYDVLCGAVPIICLLYGVLCAMAVWSYLYNARSVGGMHILPIRREGLFVTSFLSGYAMVLIPFAVTGGLCVLVTAAFGLFEPMGVAVTILGVLGESFFYFSSATLAAFITGNVFAMPAIYLLLHFLEAILDLVLSNFARGFLFGFNTDYTGVLEFLSPTVYLMRNVRVDTQYQEITRYTGTHSTYTSQKLVSVHLENPWLIAVYALAGAALLVFAFALYRRRQSERAGDVVAVGWMRPVFRYGLAGFAALLGGQLIYALFWDDADYRVVPLALCMLVCGVIGYYAASMLLQKTLRVFRRDNWKGLVLVAAGIAVVCGALELDVFGAERRVPGIDQVREMEFYTVNNTYTFYPEEEDSLLEQVRDLHAAIIADRDYIQSFDRRTFTTLAEDANWDWVYTTFTYTTRSGQTVRRTYHLPLTRDRLGQSGTYDNLLDALVNSQEMRLKRLHASGDGYEPTGGSIYLNARSEGYDLSDREAAAILEAVTRDALAGRWGQVDWLDNGSRDGGVYAMSLSLEFSKEGDEGWDWIEINIRPEMTATVSCLLELGLATGPDLVTQAELYPEAYETVEAAYPAPAEVVYPNTFNTVTITNVAG